MKTFLEDTFKELAEPFSSFIHIGASTIDLGLPKALEDKEVHIFVEHIDVVDSVKEIVPHAAVYGSYNDFRILKCTDSFILFTSPLATIKKRLRNLWFKRIKESIVCAIIDIIESDGVRYNFGNDKKALRFCKNLKLFKWYYVNNYKVGDYQYTILTGAII